MSQHWASIFWIPVSIMDHTGRKTDTLHWYFYPPLPTPNFAGTFRILCRASLLIMRIGSTCFPFRNRMGSLDDQVVLIGIIVWTLEILFSTRGNMSCLICNRPTQPHSSNQEMLTTNVRLVFSPIGVGKVQLSIRVYLLSHRRDRTENIKCLK